MNELKTVVALFDNLSEGQRAVQELRNSGFEQNDISLMANASAAEYSRYFNDQGHYDSAAAVPAEGGGGAVTGAEIGAVVGGLGGLLLSLSLLPVPGIGPIIAAGPLTATLVGALGGAVAGGLLGALTHLGVPEAHAGHYAEGVRRGGTLVAVKTDAAGLQTASQILNSLAPVDIEARAGQWRQGGWSNFDSAAQPYTADQIASERATYGAGSSLKGAVGGAVVGATAASVVPGIGTVAGGAIGAATGAMEGSTHPVGTVTGAAAGAASGAAIGSVVPGVGTGIGAAVGGVAGAISGHEVAEDVNPRRTV